MNPRVATEHRAIDALYEATLRELQIETDRDAGRAAFERLRDALESHLCAEEELYFPSLGALRPDQREILQTLVTAHGHFRATLRDVSTALEEARIPEALRALERFGVAFAGHEVREERLLESLALQLDPAAST